MRIGIDARAARWYIGSGLGNYTNNIIENIKNIDDKNEYILFFYKQTIKDKLYGSFVEGERKKDFWELMYNLRWLNQPDVDIFHNTVNGIGIPNQKNFKLVITLKDLIPYVMPETVEKPHLEYVLKHTPEVIEKADHIITVSHHSKKDIKRYFHLPEEKITVIHQAPNKIFKPFNKKKAKEIIAKEYGIKNKFILYVGGFSPRKNTDRLIRAFEMIFNELQEEHKLVIVGESYGMYENLNELSEKLFIQEKVILTGFLPAESLALFYNACEVFVYPSLYEGFGLPPLEAASCGVPIITSNTSSIPEVMGDCCTYINPYDVVNIAQGIYDTIVDDKLRNELCSKSLEHSKKYSIQKATEETVKVYNSLI